MDDVPPQAFVIALRFMYTDSIYAQVKGIFAVSLRAGHVKASHLLTGLSHFSRNVSWLLNVDAVNVKKCPLFGTCKARVKLTELFLLTQKLISVT